MLDAVELRMFHTFSMPQRRQVGLQGLIFGPNLSSVSYKLKVSLDILLLAGPITLAPPDTVLPIDLGCPSVVTAKALLHGRLCAAPEITKFYH